MDSSLPGSSVHGILQARTMVWVAIFFSRRSVQSFCKELNRELSCDLANPLLGIYPEKTIIQKDTCTSIFIAVLLNNSQEKQPKYLMTEVWIKKIWCIETVDHYSVTKRNEIGSCVDRWMDTESVTHNEVSQKEKNKYLTLMHICGI